MKAAVVLTPNDAKRLVALRDRLNEFVAQLDGHKPRRRRRRAKAAARKAKKPVATPAKSTGKKPRPGLGAVPDSE
jgi:hypothetical protein